MTTSKFAIGQRVWAACYNPRQVEVVCPVCYGKLAVVVELGDGTRIETPCDYCGKGWQVPQFPGPAHPRSASWPRCHRIIRAAPFPREVLMNIDLKRPAIFCPRCGSPEEAREMVCEIARACREDK
jgi:hypothetical protein